MSNLEIEIEKKTLGYLPHYLVLDDKTNTITPCTAITTAIRIATEEGHICPVYELAGTNGKYYNHLCDISKGII